MKPMAISNTVYTYHCNCNPDYYQFAIEKGDHTVPTCYVCGQDMVLFQQYNPTVEEKEEEKEK